MNRHTKLKNAINDVVELSLENDEIFFSQKVPQLLFRVLKLMEFPEVANSEFLRYLSFFQNDIRLDINRSLKIQASSSEEEKQDVLKLIKSHTKAKLKVVEFSFAYYIKDKTKLYKEEDHSVSKQSILVKRLHLYDWFFNHGKSGENMANSAAAS